MGNWCCVCWASTQLTNLIYGKGELVDSQSVSQTDKQTKRQIDRQTGRQMEKQLPSI